MIFRPVWSARVIWWVGIGKTSSTGLLCGISILISATHRQMGSLWGEKQSVKSHYHKREKELHSQGKERYALQLRKSYGAGAGIKDKIMQVF